MMRREEEGVALLTVLLLVAAMSALAVSVLDDIRFGIRQSVNAETIAQAQWYALGAETLARARLARLTAGGAATDRTEDWNGRWLSFPIDHGTIRVRLSDATGCFNLNSVVEGVSEYWKRRETGHRQFVVLLTALGLPTRQAESLAETLADWIDTDTSRNTSGGEDDAYVNLRHPYRTSGALLGEVSELRAIRGFTPGIYDRIRPYVCALPTADLSPINVNTLDESKAVLLTMLTEGELSPELAREVIASRPLGGWPTVDAFWTVDAMKRNLPSDPVLNAVAVRTRFFNLEAVVDYAGGEAVMTALIEQAQSGPPLVRARRWTIEE